MDSLEQVADAIQGEFARTGYSWKHPRIKAYFARARKSLLSMDTAFARSLLRKLQQEPSPSIQDRRKRMEESQ